jgi:hypothetical protein
MTTANQIELDSAIGEVERWSTGRPVDAGPVVVRIHATDDEVRDRFDALLAGFPTAPGPRATRPDGRWCSPRDGDEVDVRIHSIEWTASSAVPPSRYFDLWIGDQPRLRTHELREVEDRVLANLNRWVLDREPARLHLHAAGLRLGAATVLLVGPSGAGKSTLTAYLVATGWTYLSDEMIGLDDGGAAVVPYPRPLSLKRGSWPLFAGVPSVPAPDDPPRGGPGGDRVHVPTGELAAAVAGVAPTPPSAGSASPHSTARADLVVLVGHGDGPTAVEPVSPLDMVEGLVGECLDLGRAGPAGFESLVGLVNATPTLRLHVGIGHDGLDDADHRLREAAAGIVAPVDPALVRPAIVEPPVPGGVVPTETYAAAASLERWACTTGGGLLYDDDSGALVQLDDAGFEMFAWLAAGWTIDATVANLGAGLDPAPRADAIAGLEAFAAALVEAGLLVGRAAGSPAPS